MIKKYKKIEIITEMSAPVPADFALSGWVSFQTRYKIRPTNGTQKPSNPHPALPLSTGP
jgi:hypothetical protein